MLTRLLWQMQIVLFSFFKSLWELHSRYNHLCAYGLNTQRHFVWYFMKYLRTKTCCYCNYCERWLIQKFTMDHARPFTKFHIFLITPMQLVDPVQPIVCFQVLQVEPVTILRPEDVITLPAVSRTKTNVVSLTFMTTEPDGLIMYTSKIK